MIDNDRCCAITPDGVCNADATHTAKYGKLEYHLCAYHLQLLLNRDQLAVLKSSQPAPDERAGHIQRPRRRH